MGLKSSIILSTGLATGLASLGHNVEANTVNGIKAKVENLCAPAIENVTIDLDSEVNFGEISQIKTKMGDEDYPVLILIGKKDGGYSGVINFLPFRELQNLQAFNMKSTIDGKTLDLPESLSFWGGVVPTMKGSEQSLSFGGNCTYVNNIRFSFKYDSNGNKLGDCSKITRNPTSSEDAEKKVKDFLKCMGKK